MHDDSASRDELADLLVTHQEQSVKGSRLISRILAPAVQLWVRSQLEHVEDLQIDIAAGDRQLLSGAISRVSAAASKAIYRGLHFSQIHVVGEQIRTNLPQMLRGKAFRLLTTFPVSGEVSLSEADLNASLQAPLLADVVTEFLLTLLPQEVVAETSSQLTPPTLRDVHVQLGEGTLTFTAILVTQGCESAIAIRTGISIKNGNLLKLENFQHQRSLADLATARKTSFTFPLGSDVYLETLSLQAGMLSCKGRVTVIP